MAHCTGTGVRTAMADYWKEHSTSASLQEMMLDNDAEELHKEEMPEILSYLPEFSGKRVIELGAGIGRFTSVFAESASNVVAVDFIQEFISKNKAANSHYGNVEFQCADVTRLQRDSKSADIVFSNWLLMYLSDTEVQDLMQKLLEWLDEDGYLFIRESCFHASGNKPRTNNPTHYRDPQMYDAFAASTVVSCGENQSYGLDLVFSKAVATYIKRKSNGNQVVWLWQKVKRDTSTNQGFQTFQEFLDSQQYSLNGILRYEKIFGRTFVSTGGLATTKLFVDMLNLTEGGYVLDVGCGIGGSAFYMAKEFGARVLAMDLSANMIKLGIQRAAEVGMDPDQVTFEIADVTKRSYSPESFDIIYSRDTILHIADKLALFKRFYKWLKPGGKILISDYCCSADEHSEIFKAYVKQRGYILYSPAQYGKLLEQAGFVDVRAEDKTDLFTKVLKTELTRTEQIKDVFVKEFSQKDYDDIVSGWKDKLYRVGLGDQRWGLFYAVKP
ncbi:phosphoethanolamine N-methyltransferase 3-like isoform X1 [Haliotis rubra]|uniref:phosphoethanolamine N-methyltransferase 3-like isoform X1 n=2 Tax=Haliotis rubra TaxID=36100 RepID=UPI001EE5EC02|nr:phosphoethanolamine N-methyltransferase 3-like isoform X1 [Haliotis rubra]